MALTTCLIVITLLIVLYLNTSLAYSTKIKDKESLKGAILKVSAFEREPLMVPVRQENNITYVGVSPELTNLLADYLGMRTEYVRIHQSEFTKLGGGAAGAQQILRKEVDVANFPVPMNTYYSTLMDLSFPVWMEAFSMLQSFPEEESRLVAPIRPFSDTVWLFFLLSALAFIGVMSLLMICDPRRTDEGLDQQEALPHLTDSVYRGIEYVITIITSQGNYVPYASCLSMKILTGTWLLAMIVLVNAYAGLLTAYLSVPKRLPTVETFEDLANRPGWRITVDKNNDLANKFLTSSSGPFKVLGDQLRRDPELYITDPFKVLINVVEHKCVYPTAMSVVSFYVASDLKKSGHCRTTASIKPLLYMTAYCFGFQKNSEIKELANQGFFHYAWQMGFVGFVTRKYFPVTHQCSVDTVPKGKTSSIKLSDAFGAFVLLGIGLGLSVVTFLLELLFTGSSAKGKKEKKVRFGLNVSYGETLL